jgi:hypothetical protein
MDKDRSGGNDDKDDDDNDTDHNYPDHKFTAVVPLMAPEVVATTT